MHSQRDFNFQRIHDWSKWKFSDSSSQIQENKLTEEMMGMRSSIFRHLKGKLRNAHSHTFFWFFQFIIQKLQAVVSHFQSMRPISVIVSCQIHKGHEDAGQTPDTTSLLSEEQISLACRFTLVDHSHSYICQENVIICTLRLSNVHIIGLQSKSCVWDNRGWKATAFIIRM